jgi:[acyl-carrier-protein] S-malonyltransferase
MVSRIFMMPGQGAQYVGMGKAWAERWPEARRVFEQADALIGRSLPGGVLLSELCFGGDAETLNRTDVSQPAIFVASVACYRGLMASLGVNPDAGVPEANILATAGLSLGEYTALHVAGAMGFEEALRLVALRGRAMQDAAEAVPGGMVALIGATEEQAGEVCRLTLQDVGGPGAAQVLVCANFNAPGQIVISGSRAACERAAAADGPAARLGLRATALPVAGAFHSPLMKPAADRLEAALAKTTIHPPRCPVLSNVTGAPHTPDRIRSLLVEQLTSPVRWAECVQHLVRTGAQAGGAVEFHELAPGKTLAGLMRRIDKSVKVTNHDEPTG